MLAKNLNVPPAHGVRGQGRPRRTCVGCRETDDRDALLRVVLAGSPPRLVPDPERRLPGRGASVHHRRKCIRAAASRGGFSRAFSVALEVDASGLATLAAQLHERRVDGLLLAARRAGRLALGGEAVRACLRSGRFGGVLLLASDAAGRRQETTRSVQQAGGRTVVFRTKSELGKLFGRDEVAVLAITDVGIAAEVARSAVRAAELSEDA